jgi:hypothetical protein
MDKRSCIIINYWIENLSLSDNLSDDVMNGFYLLIKE